MNKTIWQYIQGLIQIEIKEATINSGLINVRDLSWIFVREDEAFDEKGVLMFDANSSVDVLTEKGRDLMLAQAYYWLSTHMTGGGESVQRGQLRITKARFTMGITDRRRYQERADELYAKWGEMAEVEDVVVFPDRVPPITNWQNRVW